MGSLIDKRHTTEWRAPGALSQEHRMEFWRDLKPIEKIFQADALPEARSGATA